MIGIFNVDEKLLFELFYLVLLGDHGKVCFDAMQRKQKKCLESLVYSEI